MFNSDAQIPFPDHISHPIDDVNITKILAITNIGGRLIHYVQLEGGKKTLMPSTLTNVLVPQLVIDFYQNQIFFVNIYNQRMRPIRQNVRRHARKSTNQRTNSSLSSKLLPSNTTASAPVTTGSNNHPSNTITKPSSPAKSKSLLKDLASSLAKSLNQLHTKSQPKLQPIPIAIEVLKTNPKPLSKQPQNQQSNKKPSNS